jgi:hypothetical protein
VELVLGPVSCASVRSWVAYARTVLAQAVSGTGSLPAFDTQVIEELEGYLDQWEQAAQDGDEMQWRADADPERLQFLAHTFLQLVEHLADQAETRGFPVSPPEGDEFYHELVHSIIDALEVQGNSSSAFSEQLRDRWPGFKDP